VLALGDEGTEVRDCPKQESAGFLVFPVLSWGISHTNDGRWTVLIDGQQIYLRPARLGWVPEGTPEPSTVLGEPDRAQRPYLGTLQTVGRNRKDGDGGALLLTRSP